MARLLRAKKATVEAGKLHKVAGKHHQTNTHNAAYYKAGKDVEVRIDQQYERREDDCERPPAGSVLTGRAADISSRNSDYLGPADEPKRMRGIFRRDVIIRLHEGGPGGGSGSPKDSGEKKGGRR